MDPLTHTLVGANLASTRLGDRTRLATAALVIGANLPDVDAIYYYTGQADFALGFRRGWTHGLLALLVLPFLQTGLLLLFARWRGIAVSAKWLLGLSWLAILTHPFLDWLNNYGMRWLMPFRGTWFYGDSVFIIDIWLWLVLGTGCVLRRSGRSLAALVVACLYIFARLTIHQFVESRVYQQLKPVRLMVSPHPIDPLRWDVVAQTSSDYRYGVWRYGTLTMAPDRIPLPKPSPEWEAAKRDPSIRGFMVWVRFPWYEVEESRVLVHDARYVMRTRSDRGFGNAVVKR